MFGLLNTDKYTQLNYDRATGGFNRSWIQYADNTFEPVRKREYTSSKKRYPDPAKDWWVTEKPKDWDPREHGFDVTLNHDYGISGRPTTPSQGRFLGLAQEGQAPGRSMELRDADMGRSRATLYDQKEQPQGPPQTTLARGKEAYREFEERRKAAKGEEAESEGKGRGKDLDPRPDRHRERLPEGKGNHGDLDPRQDVHREHVDPNRPDNTAQDVHRLKEWGKSQAIKPEKQPRPRNSSQHANDVKEWENPKLKKKDEVADQELSKRITEHYPTIRNIFQKYGADPIVTSANDGDHMNNSKHYSDQAIDLRGKEMSIETMKAIAADLRKQLGDDYDVLAEVKKDRRYNHIHIEYDPK